MFRTESIELHIIHNHLIHNLVNSMRNGSSPWYSHPWTSFYELISSMNRFGIESASSNTIHCSGIRSFVNFATGYILLITHSPPVCWSTFWKRLFNDSEFGTVKNILLYVVTHQYIYILTIGLYVSITWILLIFMSRKFCESVSLMTLNSSFCLHYGLHLNCACRCTGSVRCWSIYRHNAGSKSFTVSLSLIAIEYVVIRSDDHIRNVPGGRSTPPWYINTERGFGFHRNDISRLLH